MIKSRTFMCDFETTVYKGQTHTEVWAAACVELGTEDVSIFHSIDELYDYLTSIKGNITCYFHNLKFDGTFWIDFLLNTLQYKQACTEWTDENKGFHVEWVKSANMKSKTFKYLISEDGMWYSITIKSSYNQFIEIRDSLKLLPFSVKKIGKSFGTKHKKTEIEYTGFRYAGCDITDEEKEYIANDVLVVKEALEIMFAEGHNKLTIGSCCLKEFKRTIFSRDYKNMFPDMYDIPLNKEIYGSDNAGSYIKKSYKGGWCYVVKGKQKKIKHGGCTADVNSLYPSMMHSESGNYFPIGKPIFWHGNYIPKAVFEDERYYFIRIRTQFYLKDGYLPFIQIKNTFRYKQNECLESSDFCIGGTYYKYYTEDGNYIPATVELTLTKTDFILFLEHYDTDNFEILDGCYFDTMKGLFDNYINHYREIKMNSKGAKRELAKLFLNNLYGKMAAGTNSSFKYAFTKEDKSIGYLAISENNKKAGYIPIGSAITSYARNFTIRAAQKNYHGVNNRGFIYADTDSIHCDLPPEEIQGITIHPTQFCCWKIESEWDDAIFTRQKTYIERVIKEDGQPVEPYYNVKCAGMPEKCKATFVKALNLTPQETRRYRAIKEKTPEEEFLAEGKKHLTDFDIGLKIYGKLLPKRIRGGTILVETTYEMR